MIDKMEIWIIEAQTKRQVNAKTTNKHSRISRDYMEKTI